MRQKQSRVGRTQQGSVDAQSQALELQEQLLLRLNQKLESPALNGGFDDLAKKVDRIENTTDQLKETQAAYSKKIDAIHTAIYDPETGLYTKVKSHGSWINSTNQGLRWFAGLAIAGTLTGIGKLLYDFITGHILYHP